MNDSYYSFRILLISDNFLNSYFSHQIRRLIYLRIVDRWCKRVSIGGIKQFRPDGGVFFIECASWRWKAEVTDLHSFCIILKIKLLILQSM